MTKINLNEWERYKAGYHGRIFKKEDKIIKTIHKSRYTFVEKLRERTLSREFEIQNKLFEQEIRVAEPYEFVETIFEGRKNRGILMKFIPGRIGLHLPWHEQMAIAKIQRLEIDKCRQKGFEPWDYSLYNCIYSEENELYLIDFAEWRYKTPN